MIVDEPPKDVDISNYLSTYDLTTRTHRSWRRRRALQVILKEVSLFGIKTLKK